MLKHPRCQKNKLHKITIFNFFENDKIKSVLYIVYQNIQIQLKYEYL